MKSMKRCDQFKEKEIIHSNVSLFLEDNVALVIEGRWFNPKPLLCRFSQRPCARRREWVNAHL